MLRLITQQSCRTFRKKKIKNKKKNSFFEYKSEKQIEIVCVSERAYLNDTYNFGNEKKKKQKKNLFYAKTKKEKTWT